jgi:DHA2 family multidrug resistance protein
MSAAPGVTNKWVVAALVSAGIFIAFLDTTIVDITLPKMMATLETDLYGVQWVIIAYFIGAAVSMTVVGWLAEMLGHRNTYLAGLLLFVGMSALCGMAWSLPVMLGARFIQGVAEGLLIPVGWLLLADAFPAAERGLAMGIYGLGAAFAPAIGPSLGGLITEHLTWRWVFYVNVPIGLADALAVLLVLANRCGSVRRRLDLVGFALLSTALSTLVIVLSKGQEKGWLHSDFILRLTLLCLATLVGFVAWELLAREPLLPRALFTRREVVVSLLGMGLVSMTGYGVFLMMPVYLERLRGFTTLDAGLIMLPGSLLAAVATLLTGAVSDRLPPKWIAFAFLAATAWATWVFRTGFYDPRSAIVTDNLVWGFALGGTFTPVAYLLFASLQEHQFADGSMVINVVRLVAGSVGTAYSTNVLTNRSAAFYDALTGRLDWGTYAGRAMAAALAGLWGGAAGPYDNPDATHAGLAIGRSLIQAIATGEAFHAAYRHLALFALAGAVIMLAARSLRSRAGGRAH